MKAVRLAEKRPAFGLHVRILEFSEPDRKAHKYEEPVHIALPALNQCLVVFLRLGDVYRPDPGSCRVCVVADIRACG
jgi:hypothetical protein